MPEVIMQYDINECDMVNLKRKGELIRCRECKHFTGAGIDGIWLCDITLRVKGKYGYCDEAERRYT